MAIDRKGFVPVEGDLTLDSGTSHVIPGSSRSTLDDSYIGGRSVTHVPSPLTRSDGDSPFDPKVQKIIDLFNSVADKSVDTYNGQIDVSQWKSDPNADASTNLLSLEGYIESLFNLGSLGLDSSTIISGYSYANIMSKAIVALRSFVEENTSWWYGNDYRWAILEKTCDTAQRYIDTVFNQALSYKAWYMQQDYNTPANQLKRLEAAGMSSAFIFGGLSSGSSSTSPSVIPGSQSSMSGAAEVAQQQHAASQSNDVALMESYNHSSEATTALLNHNVNSIKTLAEADNIRKMTPIQVASSLQEFLNLGVTYDYLNSEVLKIENDTFSDWFKNDFQSYQTDLQSADNRVKQIQKDIETASNETFALGMGSKLFDKESYTGYVKNKSGQLVRKDYTLDQLSNAFSNNGYDEEGNEVFSEDDLRSSGSVNGGLSVPALGFNVGASGTLESGEKEGEKKSSKHGSSRSRSDSNSHSTGHYDDQTRTLTIGNQHFTRTITRELMNSKKYIDYMNNLRDDLVKAKNDYFILTSGERARAFQNYQMYLENKAKGLSWSHSLKFRNAVNSLLQSNTMIGD